MTVLAALALLVWCYLLLAHGRFWQAGPVLDPATPAQAPAVDVVIPARDEAESIEATLRSLLAQAYAGELRVILVDDGSTDGTGAIARDIMSSRPAWMPGSSPGMTSFTNDASNLSSPPDLIRGSMPPRLTVIDGAPRPPGWSGKLWAVAQGVERSTAPLILLTDADIVHEPAHIATLVAKAERDRLDLVSEIVELRAESWAERALVPAFVFFFQLLYPFARVNDPRSRTAAAAGGTMLVRRTALERIGGIESLRGALIDDVTLAARIKPGGPIYLGHSFLARSLRPYPGAADIWRMVARTAYVQLRFSPLLLLGTVAGLGLIWLAPPLLAIFGGGPARIMGALAWAGSALSFLPTLGRFRQSALWAVALPAIASFYMAATLGSALDHHRGRGVMWKRRAYRDAGP